MAEVLITLGIIGVVAAMTIPNLMANMQEKKTITILKETQSILAQAFRLTEEENGTPESWDIANALYDVDSATKIVNFLKPHLKLALDCGFSDSKGECVWNGTYKYLNGNPWRNLATTNGVYKITLMNGTSIAIGTNTGFIDFFIDVNGNKLPNIIGKDLFAFSYYYNRGLMPDGDPNIDDTPYTYRCKNDGWGCTYYILRFGNMNYLHR